METKRSASSPGARVAFGNAILAGAKMVNTEALGPRLAEFTDIHRRYLAGFRNGEVVETQLDEAYALLAQRETAQDDAVEGIARSLINEGYPRTGTFTDFGSATPTLLKKLTGAEKAAAVHTLVAAIQRSNGLSQAIGDAARAADKLAAALEAALLSIETLKDDLRMACQKRDALGPLWDAALKALRRRSRIAADDGAPHLYASLFGSQRPKAKRPKRNPQPANGTGTEPPAETATPAVAPGKPDTTVS